MSRSDHVRAAIETATDGGSVIEAICVVTRRLLAAEYVAVSFDTASGPVTVEGSDVTAARLDLAQTVAGDGPLISGAGGDLPFVVGDLHAAVTRWPALSDVLAVDGIELGSMIVLPLRIGSARLGLVSVYRRGLRRAHG